MPDSRNSPDSATRSWRIGSQNLVPGETPWLMGIVNTTPDSFSDGGKFVEPTAAVDWALRLVEDGADIIDIGGESTRPGADPVGADEEVRRVVPVIEQIARHSNVLISVDTTKGVVARASLSAGARIVNDISGLTFDPEMTAVCAAAQAGIICMHMRGTPQTMQNEPRYDDVVEEICRYLDERMLALAQQGISRECVAIDPGIGFGKTAAHNLEILRNIAALRGLRRPVCIGHSRKQFLKKLLGRPVDERLFATVGISVAVALQGAEIIRVHDVAATRDAILACRAILPAGSII